MLSETIQQYGIGPFFGLPPIRLWQSFVSSLFPSTIITVLWGRFSFLFILNLFLLRFYHLPTSEIARIHSPWIQNQFSCVSLVASQLGLVGFSHFR
jgi:hypothetical protein